MKRAFLKSTDSLSLHPENASIDFTVELPRGIQASECALSSIYYDESFEDRLYVLCDICEHSIAHDTTLPILRLVQDPGEVSNLQFIPVVEREIKRMRIKLVKQSLDPPSSLVGDVTCVIIFKL